MANIKTEDLGSKLDPDGTYIIEVGGRRKPSADGATIASTLTNWAGAAAPGSKALILDAADGKAVGTVVAAESKEQTPEPGVITSQAKVVESPKSKSKRTPAGGSAAQDQAVAEPKKSTAKKSTARRTSQK